MFKAFYGFSVNPFDKNSIKEKDAFISNDHKQMVDRLKYLKDVRGIGVFTSPPGMGKSFALRCFAADVNPQLFQLAYICLSTVNVTDFYRQICTVLGLEPTFRKVSMFSAIQERIYNLYKTQKRPLILMIDEAQELTTPIFKDLKMIMNFEYDALNCFALALIGEPHLNAILDKQIHEALRQRITIHYDFSGLSAEETETYVKHKFALAGASTQILGAGVMDAIKGHCQGNPRLTDKLLTEMLTLGAQHRREVVDTEVVMAAINNMALR